MSVGTSYLASVVEVGLANSGVLLAIIVLTLVLPLGYMLLTTNPAEGEPRRAGIIGRISALVAIGAISMIFLFAVSPDLSVEPEDRFEYLLWLLAYLTPLSTLIVWQWFLYSRVHKRSSRGFADR